MKLEAIIEKKKEYNNAVRLYGKNAVATAFRDFFKKHPFLMNIVWTQYTPYFNDGDPCVFHVHELNYKVDLSIAAKMLNLPSKFVDLLKKNDPCETFVDEINWYIDNEKNRKQVASGAKHDQRKLFEFSDKAQEFCLEFEELDHLCCNNDDVMKFVFGDHVSIVASPEGFDVSDYDHE